MASMDLVTTRRDPERMTYAVRGRVLFALWMVAMRLLAWRQAMSTSGSGDAA